MATDYSGLMNSINSEKERSRRMMSSLRVEDKIAILQLVCQLILSADGSMVEERDNCVVDYVLKELGQLFVDAHQLFFQCLNPDCQLCRITAIRFQIPFGCRQQSLFFRF